MVDFDDIARSKIDFVMVSGVLFEGTSLVPIWKTLWSGLSLETGFTWSAIHLTVARWEGQTNTFEFSVLREMPYPLTCLTMLSPTIYTCFVLDGFRTFLLFISFLTLPFITDAFTLRVSLEVLLCSVIDRLKSVSFGSNDVLFFFNSGDFSLLAILSSWIVLLMLFLWGVLQDRFSKSCVCRLTLSL